MKKLLLVMIIGAFVACNDNAGTEGTTTDTTTVAPATVDTNTVAPLDTTSRVDTSAAGTSTDTTVKK